MSLLSRFRRLTSSSLARNTAWMFGSQIGRTLLQGFYFILLARALDSDGLGTLAGVSALIMVLLPFADWGSGNVLIMRAARERDSFAVYWGNALLLTFVSSSVFISLVVTVSALIFTDIAVWGVVVPLAVADLYFRNVIQLCAHAFQATERLRVTATLLLLVSVTRFVAALLFVLLPVATTVPVWALFYLVSTLLLAVPVLVLSLRKLARPQVSLKLLGRNLGNGFFFSLSISSNSVSADIDKTMLLRFGSAEIAGVYTAAYRLIGMSITPLRAFLAATYSRFFQAGDRGVAGTLELASNYLKPLFGFGGLMSVGLFVVAPVIPLVLGEDFAASVTVLRWLALFPLIKVVQSLYADVLTGAGMQRLRGLLQGGVALLNVGLNLWLIPLYTWRGAVVATLVCEAVLALCYIVFAYTRAGRRAQETAREVV